MKKIFVAASYSSKVDYSTGLVSSDYKKWLESQLDVLEGMGHEVFCALRADEYRISDDNTADAFSLDISEIKKADVILALLTDRVSAGVQVEIGYALALGKEVILTHDKRDELTWFNKAIISAEQAKELILPITEEQLL